MTTRYILAVLASLALAGCGGNPLGTGEGGGGTGTDTGTGDQGGGGGGIGGDIDLPPGTGNPSPTRAITRYEKKDDKGNGYVSGVHYDKETDSFSVDGLAFDGDNSYSRETKIGNFGNVSIFEGKPLIPDGFTGSPIGQITPHRALYGVNTDGTMRFAIVRTGGYTGYGFGGFIYQRDGGVTLPGENTGSGPYKGQAHYKGTATGLRDFDGRGALEYSTAEMTMDIDFDDFNDGKAVKGRIYNRQIFDIEGNDITDEVVQALEAKHANAQIDDLPEITFKIQPGVMNRNGEITGSADSKLFTSEGIFLDSFETGKYYAVLGGNNAENVVGIVVVEADDPRWDGVTVRETDGFMLYRNP